MAKKLVLLVKAKTKAEFCSKVEAVLRRKKMLANDGKIKVKNQKQ